MAGQFTLGRDERNPAWLCCDFVRCAEGALHSRLHLPSGRLRFCLLWRWRKPRRNIVRRHSTDDAPSLFGLHPCMSETRGVGAFIRACAISTVNGCAIQGDNNISEEFSDRQRIQSVVQYFTFRHETSDVVFINRVVLEAGPTDKPIIPKVEIFFAVVRFHELPVGFFLFPNGLLGPRELESLWTRCNCRC